MCDQDKIAQVLNNLIGNALKFTDKGKIMVETRVKDEQYQILVEDTGVGIGKKDLARIFGKFEQVTTVQAGKPAGTGLGLYISQQIARKMGGDVWIEKTVEGKGSTFGYSLIIAGSNKAKEVQKMIGQEAKLHPDQKELS